MKTRLFIFWLGTIFLNGCGTISVRDLPPSDIQPVIGARTASLVNAANAHSLWLAETSRHSEASTNAELRASMRPRGLGKKNVPKAAIPRIVEDNRALSSYLLEKEAIAYRSKKKQPGLCVALSGGGIRAAAFGIGVLQGLHESKKLKGVDIVSAVSGGAYALAWYSQKRIKEGNDNVVLSDSFVKSKINPSLFSLSTAILGVVGSVTNALTDGSAFSNGIDVPSLSSSYYGMLANSFDIPLFWGALKKDSLVTSVVDGHIPLPIIGISALPLAHSTVAENGAPSEALTATARSVALFDTYMEVTPFRIGIHGFGFHKKPPTPLSDDLWHYVRLSGAALDQPHEPESLRQLSGPLRLGGVMSLVVAKRYPFSESTKVDEFQRQFFYVSDGGFAENLGAFPLILRQCETIVIADSEYDPEWVFEAYRVLKHRLSTEHDIDITVENLDNKDGLFSKVKRVLGVEDYVRPDGIDLLRTKNECARPPKPDLPVCMARSAKSAVFYGFATRIPLSMESVSDPKTTKIIYLKLGLPEETTERKWPEFVRKHVSKCMETPDKCHFPHDPTIDAANLTQTQKYSADQFQAYKDLARGLTKSIVW